MSLHTGRPGPITLQPSSTFMKTKAVKVTPQGLYTHHCTAQHFQALLFFSWSFANKLSIHSALLCWWVSPSVWRKAEHWGSCRWSITTTPRTTGISKKYSLSWSKQIETLLLSVEAKCLQAQPYDISRPVGRKYRHGRAMTFQKQNTKLRFLWTRSSYSSKAVHFEFAGKLPFLWSCTVTLSWII